MNMEHKSIRIEKRNKWVFEDEVFILPTITIKKRSIGTLTLITIKLAFLKNWIKINWIYYH